jgi:hypothetical protein
MRLVTGVRSGQDGCGGRVDEKGCVKKRNKEYDEAELSQTPNRTALWWSNVALAACWLK